MVKSYLYVHTKGSSPCECYLSNLQMLKTPLVYRGGHYPSIEHAFQAAKYDYTDALPGAKQTPGEVKRWFHVGEKYGKLPATKAVSKGKRANMGRLKMALRIEEWNGAAVQVMKDLMRARAKVDPAFAACLVEARKKKGIGGSEGMDIFHKEKGGPRAVWGGTFAKGTKDRDKGKATFVGRNQMGKLLEEVGDELKRHKSLDSLLGHLPVSTDDCSFKASAAAARRAVRSAKPKVKRAPRRSVSRNASRRTRRVASRKTSRKTQRVVSRKSRRSYGRKPRRSYSRSTLRNARRAASRMTKRSHERR
jgi:hypothetical protein